jgi:antitoxin component YwqK of YwqJK toxin-antitoxin module
MAYFPNNTEYEGDWNNDKMDGFGTFYFSNGAKYTGEFKDGLMHGHGTYHYRNGDSFEGEFRNNKREGRGRFIHLGRGVVFGYWENDKMVREIETDESEYFKNGYVKLSFRGSHTVTYVTADNKSHCTTADRIIEEKDGFIKLRPV